METWSHSFYKVLQTQWVRLLSTVNALVKIDTAANRPATPFLNEILFYEQDTGRSYVAVSGNWIVLTGWAGTTVSTTSSMTIGPTHATVLADATSGALIITVPSTSTGRTYAVKKVDATANIVYVQPSVGSIDGAASKNVAANYDTILVTAYANNLYMVSTS